MQETGSCLPVNGRARREGLCGESRSAMVITQPSFPLTGDGLAPPRGSEWGSPGWSAGRPCGRPSARVASRALGETSAQNMSPIILPDHLRFSANSYPSACWGGQACCDTGHSRGQDGQTSLPLESLCSGRRCCCWEFSTGWQTLGIPPP